MRGLGVHALLVSALAFVLGVVAGGIAPRSEVRELKDRIADLERARARSGSVAGRGLARLLTGGGADGADEVAPEDEATEGLSAALDDASESRLAGQPPSEPTIETLGGAPRDGGAERDVDPREAAREVLAMRSSLARAALVEDASPTDAQLGTIDVALAGMNDDLMGVARELADRFAAEGEPSRRELMTLGADVLDILVDAEQRMLDTLTPEQRQLVREEATDPTSYVEPEVVEVLLQMEGLPR